MKTRLLGLLSLVLTLSIFLSTQDAFAQKSGALKSTVGKLKHKNESIQRVSLRSSLVDSLILSYYDLDAGAVAWTVDVDFDGVNQTPPDSGFVMGPNIFGDKAKALAFTVPDSLSDWVVAEVGIVFSYLRPDISTETYDVLIMNGTLENGPSGTPLFSESFALADAAGDIFDHSENENDGDFTVNVLSQNVLTDRLFYVVVDFTASMNDPGLFGIAASDEQGIRVPEAWELWFDDTWHNLSDEWSGFNNNGVYPWIDVTLLANLPTSIDIELPREISGLQGYPNPAAHEVTFRLDVKVATEIDFQIFDSLGRNVKEIKKGLVLGGQHILKSELSGLRAGLYFARLETDSGIATVSFSVLP